jgi:hypothetical protein
MGRGPFAAAHGTSHSRVGGGGISLLFGFNFYFPSDKWNAFVEGPKIFAILFLVPIGLFQVPDLGHLCPYVHTNSSTFRFFFYPEDGSSIFRRSVGNSAPIYTMSCRRRESTIFKIGLLLLFLILLLLLIASVV